MKTNVHKILATKYRPKNFNELIGQDIMVQTITNSIKLEKLPNAFLLTGIRGVGKTTTARLIAKAINCKKKFILNKDNELCTCKDCEEISGSRHLDVLEMDAASKTGIDDIRELIESSRYNPTSAKYKIFIIDEVHMLSKQAFNGLLKTLEEPPPYLKFIFATTEIKKIPFTIISRCQRFDLHRVSIKILFEYLKRIAKIENCKISDQALILISKAAEGSVRDSLSLLDRAIISQNFTKSEIDDRFVRKMLGIANRSKTLELIKFIFEGEKKSALNHLKEMIDEGLDPTNFLNDFLETIYLLTRQKDLGEFDSDLSISEAELANIKDISEKINIKTLTLFWQFILKAIQELSVVSNQFLSLEMVIIRLIHLKDMPSLDEVINKVNQSQENLDDTNMIGSSMQKEDVSAEKEKNIKSDQLKNIVQTKTEPNIKNEDKENNETFLSINNFEELIKIASKEREIELKFDLERNVNLVKFSQGKIDISFNENLGKDFIRNLTDKLLLWTGKRWIISLTKEKGQKTFAETNILKKKQLMADEKKGKMYNDFKKNFSDVELLRIEED